MSMRSDNRYAIRAAATKARMGARVASIIASSATESRVNRPAAKTTGAIIASILSHRLGGALSLAAFPVFGLLPAMRPPVVVRAQPASAIHNFGLPHRSAVLEVQPNIQRRNAGA